MPTEATSSPSAQPPRHHITVLGRLLKYIPQGIVQAAAREHGVDAQARTYSVWSHLAAMVFVQLAHAFSLNDVCDWLRLKRRAIAGFGVTPPARNTLAHANKGRSADFVQSVFWRTLAHLHRSEPAFGGKRKGRRLLHRFKVKVHAVDSTVMELVANCMDWPQHRRRSRSRRGGRDRRRGTSRPQGEGAVGRRLSQRRCQAAPAAGHRQFSARLRHRGHRRGA